tara:strand:- start:458 stop:682 length:225 start_codon:yes stop_codon:yes gene_type:complete
MELPKFFIADNSNLENELFVLHTQYPRFLINVYDDSINWMEEFDSDDKEELEKLLPELIDQALIFYDDEIKKIE